MSGDRQDQLLRLMQGVRADLDGYRQLSALLERQHAAALRHDAQALPEVTEGIVALVDAMEPRSRERTGIVRSLCGRADAEGMRLVLASMPEAARNTLSGWWDALEPLVRDCHAQNLRTRQLMVDQSEVMRRVLQEEQGVYAPQ
ncbi:flagellar export chaperone FlgN [Paracidovorax anthurii]|uniref:Flagella synthesis protein FlgN n=1 Tax=Paracidovorax anthurii TaxID=78229 RepID=A0A328YSL6_9BURK|nr:flagellar export chaperone FlgN [Paracidovorax anthurii]RAR76839.1 flagella synthesis protein FlgN [Paracidovorax anthurii]WCM93786.1 flagellar protein FlgN [Acidovorax sp. NCPPB 2350]